MNIKKKSGVIYIKMKEIIILETIYNTLNVIIGIAFAVLIFNLPKVFGTGYFDKKENKAK